MELVHAIVLAVVQGLTEFLPVSSDGHLVLVPWILGWDDQGLAFDGAIHLGTLGAVVFFFRRELYGVGVGLVRGTTVNVGGTGGNDEISARRLSVLIVLALVPTALIGLALKSRVEGPLRTPEWAAAFLIVTAGLLVAGEMLGKRSRGLSAAGPKDGLLMGVAQGLAVFPGLSRSGSTIAMGMARGLTREAAGRLSFLMAVPAIAGAGVLLVADLASADDVAHPGWGVVIVGVVTAFVTGMAALRLLMWLLRRGTLWPFAAYCLIVGVAVLIARAVGA